MDSRAAILNKVRQNKPSIETNINLSQFHVGLKNDLIQAYCESLKANGGDSIVLNNKSELEEILTKEIAGQTFVDLTNTIQSPQRQEISKINHPKELANVKVLIVQVKLGVAENAAIWLEDEMLQKVRVLPFIVERSIFIIHKESIVPTMHHAYQELGTMETGFGIFIAGPSKTADIEQNLVIGAHGTKSHLVILI
jgi:L-lactate dehydrogenase complex protein LldG